MAEFLGALIFLGLWIVFCLVMCEEEPDTPSKSSSEQSTENLANKDKMVTNNKAILDAIIKIIKQENRPVCCTDISSIFEISVQKACALMRQLVANEELISFEEKGIRYYQIAPPTNNHKACSINPGDKTDEVALLLLESINNNPSAQTK